MSHHFDHLINSKNIETAFGLSPECLIYSGVPAEMFTANKFPEKDREIIENAKNNIRLIRPKKVILISTVAVYDRTENVNEDDAPNADRLTPYGRNRLELETWVENNYEDRLIVRLPAIYGENLKKNFIYDFIHYIPALLTQEKYSEFSQKAPLIRNCYERLENGFYQCRDLDEFSEKRLRDSFRSVGFSALNFTDSRSVYQFLWLKNLYGYISACIDRGIQKINLVTPPIGVSELYTYLTGEHFENITNKAPFNYNIRTKFSDTGYIMTKEEALSQIKQFVRTKIGQGTQ